MLCSTYIYDVYDVVVILGHWLAHCETKASLQFYLLGYRAHSSPGHSMSFKGNLYETPFETAR